MIKSGLKKYFFNLKYYFTPVGTLAVGMVIGLCIFLPAALSAIGVFIDEVAEVLQSNDIDYGPTKDYIVNSITSLDWTNPIGALKVMLNGEWLKSLINGSMEHLGVELKAYADVIDGSFSQALNTIVIYLCVFIFFSILGLLFGFMLTKYLVRRNMAKRGIWKAILAALIDSVLSASLFALCIWLITLWTPSIIFTTILSLMVYTVISLLEAYLIHAFKKVPLKKIIDGRNVLKLVLTDVIIFYISLAFLAVSILITNIFVGLFIGFAFVEIAFIVITLNAESYVVDLVQADV